MSSADKLNAAISAADAEIGRLKRRPGFRGWPDKSKPFLVVFLLVVLVGLLFFSRDALMTIFLGKPESEAQSAIVDLLIEADGDVVSFYQVTGELPEQLSSPALGALVDYARIDDTRYVLTPVYPVYKVKLERDVDVMLVPAEVASLVDKK